LLCACGPSDIALGSFALPYARAVCGAQARCQTLSASVEGRCRAALAASLDADVHKALAAGRLRYDGGAARTCVDGLDSTRCLSRGPTDATQAACYRALQGTVAAGQPCSFLFECSAGLCVPDSTCPASCPTLAPRGQPCSAQGPFCDERVGLVCIGGVCAPPGASGASCALQRDCQIGLLCAGSRCVSLHRAGEPCERDENCDAGTFCAETCQPRLGAGASCGADADTIDAALRGAQCADGLVCKGAALTTQGAPVGGTCAAPAAEKSACAVDPGGLQLFIDGCQGGLFCSGGACAPLPASGPCAPHGACDGASYCDASDACQPLKPDGATCQTPVECAGSACPAGQCGPDQLLCHEA
jgi:hypothetical protein